MTVPSCNPQLSPCSHITFFLFENTGVGMGASPLRGLPSRHDGRHLKFRLLQRLRQQDCKSNLGIVRPPQHQLKIKKSIAGPPYLKIKTGDVGIRL